jgi:hypothetical protein
LPDPQTPKPAKILAQSGRISYILLVIPIGLAATHNQDRRQAMKLAQAIQVYQECHKMNSGKEHD